MRIKINYRRGPKGSRLAGIVALVYFFLFSSLSFANSLEISNQSQSSGKQQTLSEEGLSAIDPNHSSSNGYLQAHASQEVLDSEQTLAIGFDPRGLINFSVGNNNKTNTTHKPIKGNNSKVFVSTSAAAGILDNSVNMHGVEQVKSVRRQGNVIVLDGSEAAPKVSQTKSQIATKEIKKQPKIVKQKTYIPPNPFLIGKTQDDRLKSTP